MSAQPKLQYGTPEPYERVIPPTGYKGSRRQPLSFTMGHMIIVWSISAGLMIACFFFGLYAGKDRGMELALEEQARIALRMPLPTREAAELGPLSSALAEEARSDSLLSANTPETPTLNLQSPEKTAAKVAEKEAVSRTVISKNEPAPAKKVQKSEMTIGQKALARKPSETSASQNSARSRLKEKAVTPDKSASVTVASSVSSGFYVQVAAKRTLPPAQELAGSIAKGKFATTIEKTTVKGTKFYRVLVGPFKNAKVAKQKQKDLISSGLSTKRAFVKRVK